MNLGNFYSGREFEAYEYLGAHTVAVGTVFRTYAPAAKAVSVIGEFNGWTDTPMHRTEDGKFWEVWIDSARDGMMYKFRIYRQDGSFMDHVDPYAFFSEKRPGTASVIYDRERYRFEDADWMWSRRDRRNEAMNIYEMHLSSWRRKDDPEELDRRINHAKETGECIDVSDGWYTYEEIADRIIPYLTEHGYNYLELMPLNEYPADESWGYQALGFFSATSRYGNPDGLKRLIDRCHAKGIGVILDVVTVHFAVNDYGLYRYDGTPIYENPNSSVGRSEWGSCNFDHSRGEVRSFLNSASEFWLHDYHFDGLRFDAVGNLIYWQGDERRGVNTNATEFLRRMNAGLKERDGNVILIAEDSSAFFGVTKPVREGGLGFDYKWDMGWMNDTLDFFRTGKDYRSANYHKLTFSMQYFYNEKYLLPLSHDEVVHGKATILQKMAGGYDDKFPQMRALFLYMYAHPGKILNFMGNEFGQFREWDEKKQQDWFMTRYPIHDSLQRFVDDLNRLYLAHSAFWERDYDRNGFEWMEADDTLQCVYIFRRISSAEKLIFFFNLSGWDQCYRLYPKAATRLELLIDSDEDIYSGGTHEPLRKIEVSTKGYDMYLKAFSGRCYRVI
jgi:1,4-alpha-glucan branching enzyme